MNRPYRVLPAADRDLDDQAAYLAAEASLKTALRFYDAASFTFGKIAQMPGMGEPWESANPRLAGLRVHRVEGFTKESLTRSRGEGSWYTESPIDSPRCVPGEPLSLAGHRTMTGFRKSMAQGLVATTLLCAVGFMACGSVSARGNAWERVCIVLVLVMLASMFSALSLVAATYLKFRGELVKHVGRPPLSDEEFAAMLPDPAGVDPELVGRIRALAAHYFRSIGGDRFYPEDRLEEDLHLLDVAPFACESFCAGLEESLELENEEIHTRVAKRQLTTFGDIILIASSLAGQSKKGVQMVDQKRSDPVWDRALDG